MKKLGKLLDYGFNNYTYKEFAKKDDIIKTITVNKGVESQINAVFETDSGTLLKKGQDKDVTQTISIDENLNAPISKGQKIGEASYTLDGEIVATTTIISDRDVSKDTFLNVLFDLYKKWFCLLR